MTVALILMAAVLEPGEVPLKPSEGLAALYANLDDRIHSQACGKQFVGKPIRMLLADWLDAESKAAPGTASEPGSNALERKFTLSCFLSNRPSSTKGGWACSLWVEGVEKQHGGLVTWFFTRGKRYLRDQIICNEEND